MVVSFILIILGLLAVVVGIGFLRSSGWRGATGVALALASHLAFALWDPPAPAPEPSAPREPVVVEIVEPERPREPEPEPPKPEPEPEPEPEQPKPEPKPKPKKTPPRQPKSKPRTETPPAASDASSKPLRFDMSQLNQGSGSGVKVQAGSPGGVPGGRGTGTKPTKSKTPQAVEGPAKAVGPTWAPVGDVYVRKMPMPVRVPKVQCPEVQNGISGTVRLRVQIRKTGAVRKVKVLSGIGGGCDEIAVKALRRAKFKPATANKGEAVDFEVTYEYAFKLEG